MKLHAHTQAIASVPLEFSISGQAPTQEHIEARVAELAPRVRNMQILGYLYGYLLVITGIGSMFALASSYPLWVAVITLSVLLPSVALSAVCLGVCDSLHRRMEKELSLLKTLDAACYPRMMEMCQASPEAVGYRAQVLAQGREFVVAEYRMLRTWSDTVDARHLKEALYGDSLKGEGQ